LVLGEKYEHEPDEGGEGRNDRLKKILSIRRSITREEIWVRTGPVHKGTRKTREIRKREEGRGKLRRKAGRQKMGNRLGYDGFGYIS